MKNLNSYVSPEDDLRHHEEVEHDLLVRTNKALLIGWGGIIFILMTQYLVEVLRGVRSWNYFITFLLVTIAPSLLAVYYYLKNTASKRLQYYIVIGYTIMYAFVLLTGSTMVVFTYILPMLSLLVLYHNPKLIIMSAVLTLILNLAGIYHRTVTGDLADFMDKDVRIQLAVLFVCYVALYFAARIYDSIYRRNIRFTKELSDQKEELYQQAEELEALNGELNQYSDELKIKNDQLTEMTMQTIETIANTIDAKDEYTRGHSRRVSDYSAILAKEIGLDEEEQKKIRFIGLLHDIGKIGVPDTVLNKPGKLTNEEYQLMKEHTTIGGEILKDITLINDLDIGAKYHHERYDGKGYPEGLSGEEIPLTARIIAVADAYDAMTSNRVYRRHLDAERVLAELEKGRGSQFDPAICDALLKMIREKRITVISEVEESKEVKQASKILTRIIDKAEETAMEDLHYDELTQTLVRENGFRVIQNEIAKEGKGSVFVMDLDHFRRVNEREGFVTGDKYLSRFASELRGLFPEATICRYGADEFVAYLPKQDSREDAEKAAQRLLDRIHQVADQEPAYHLLSACVGMTQVAMEKDRINVLYEYASNALFVAKQKGEGQSYYYKIEYDDYEDEVAAANSTDLVRLRSFLTGSALEEAADRAEVEDNENLKSFVDKAEEIVASRVEGETLWVILLTIRWKDNRKYEPSDREEVMNLLEGAIRRSLRKDDVFVRYSNMQFAVLLPKVGEDVLRHVTNRIMTGFYRTNSKYGAELHYDVEAV